MRNDWVLTHKRNMTDTFKYFVQFEKDYASGFETIIHTGTWDECVALGKMLGCMYWYDSTDPIDPWTSIEEPPNEK